MDINQLILPHVRMWSSFEILCFLALFIVLFIILYNLYIRKKINKIQVIGVILLFIYYMLVYGSCVFTRNISHSDPELEIFWSWKIALKGNRVFLIEIIMNIVMFIPIGLLYRMIDNRFFRCFVIGMLLTLTIEMSQLIFQRGLFELDDIIHNVLGCMIGYVISCWIVNVLSFIRKYNKA